MVTQSKSTVAFNMKNLHRGGWLIQSVNLAKWGHEVILQSIFDPDFPDSTQFKLVFSQCLNFVWDTEENEFDERDLEADVIGFHIDDELDHKKALVMTDLFSLTITYQEMTIQKSW